ncbi:MAG: regulator of replication initiation timing [Roseivirga sp.]|jgi:regulator of replication initiation timing
MAELSLFDRLAKVEDQLKKLVQQHILLRDEKEVLAKNNIQLKTEINNLKGEVINFKSQDKITKIVNNTTVEREESTELKHKLNEYIREIDKCIAHLSE